MITIISLLFLVLTQPQETIYEIDRGEAEFYRLFTDVDSFISAKFYSVEDSIQILFSYIAKGDTVDSLVNVSKSVFEVLQFYQKNFYKIITDLNFRKEFIKNYEIDWPIISTKDLAKDKKTALLSAFFNSACCITGTGATGAYIGALVGRSIQKETGYIPCGSQEYSCMIPYEYYSYTLNKTKYYTGVGIGIAGGTIASKMLYFKNWKKNVLFNTLAHDVVAFDDNGIPITKNEVDREFRGQYTVGFGMLGIVIGGSLTLAEILLLTKPWFDLTPKTDWDEKAVTIPILLISGASFWHFTKFTIEKGKELDHLATIERIKQKRNIIHKNK
ncbi:MAG: hypothetical protein ABIL46_08535 [candidate division WOR-3 bacterium]